MSIEAVLFWVFMSLAAFVVCCTVVAYRYESRTRYLPGCVVCGSRTNRILVERCLIHYYPDGVISVRQDETAWRIIDFEQPVCQEHWLMLWGRIRAKYAASGWTDWGICTKTVENQPVEVS